MAAESLPAIMSRGQAKSLGLKWYFTGAPCKHGHVAQRLVSNGTCQPCAYAKWHQYREARPDEFRAMNKRAVAKFEASHPEARKQYYLKHIDRHKAHGKKWPAANRERSRAIKAAWKSRNKAWVNAWATKRRAILLSAMPAWLTKDHHAQIAAIYAEAQDRGPGWHVDHIVPLINPVVCGLHVPWNLRVIPAAENWSKNNKLIEEAA